MIIYVESLTIMTKCFKIHSLDIQYELATNKNEKKIIFKMFIIKIGIANKNFVPTKKNCL